MKIKSNLKTGFKIF